MAGEMVPLDCGEPIWDRFYLVAPLVLVGSLDPDGNPDLAAKHMAGPMSWENHWGFVCTPSHATYRNVRRTGVFTVSYPSPDQIVAVSLSTAPRLEETKPSLTVLETVPATEIAGVHLAGAPVMLECLLDRVVDGVGSNSIVIGKVVAARVAAAAERGHDRDPADVLSDHPLLAFLSPDRFAAVSEGNSFPFHAGWRR